MTAVRGRLGRGRAVLLVALLGVALLALALPTWARAVAPTTVGSEQVAVGGSQAAPGVAAAALVVVVAGLVLGLAGRVTRVLAIVGVVIGGLLAAASAARFLLDPEPAVLQAAAATSGVPQIEGDVTVTPWPVAALVVAGVVLLLGLALPVLAGSWQQVGRRYERNAGGPRRQDAATSRTQAMDDWDALTRGDDPSS